MRYLFLSAWFVFLTLVGYGQKEESKELPPKPKNLILIIGDGMGVTQLSSLYYFSPDVPSFSQFQSIGLMQTSSASHKVTDSAAAGTALSMGEKTDNRAIGVDADGKEHPTILEELVAKGFSTGLIATSSITHATPASFYAHVMDRKMEEDIAEQLVGSGVDFFAAGGFRFFGDRTDEKDLVAELTKEQYTVFRELPNNIEGTQKIGILAADKGMPTMQEGRGDFLPKASELALSKFQQQSKRFFLMIEGSQIDWGGHKKDSAYVVSEMIDLDQVIHKVLKFAKEDGETLVVVTADHETGGMALTKRKSHADDNHTGLGVSFVNSSHTATLVPVLAFGPGAESFQGIYENTDLYTKMKNALLGNRQ